MHAWVTVWEGTDTGIPAPMPDSRAMLDVRDSFRYKKQRREGLFFIASRFDVP